MSFTASDTYRGLTLTSAAACSRASPASIGSGIFAGTFWPRPCCFPDSFCRFFAAFFNSGSSSTATAARWLGGRPGIDKHRLGLWGWSYGGYLTVTTLLRTGKLFRAGVAVAPVADWTLYDTAYTERYLGHPKSPVAQKAYAQSNPVRFAKGLQTNLLLVHGMADDNVLLQHTLMLAQAFQKHGRRFDLMLYPGKKHSIKGTDTRKHLLGGLLAYFQRHLMAPSSPSGRAPR